MVEFFIGFRYITERKFQSIFSILGVAIAITVFIVSVTVSNGLEKNMVSSLLTLSPEISIKNNENSVIENYTEMVEKLKKIQGITGVVPKISTQSIIKINNLAKGVLSEGISYENVKEDLRLKIVDGNNEIEELNSILIGEELSKEMGIKIGDELSLVSSENKELKLIVKGIFKTGFLQYDSNLVIIPMKTMEILVENEEIATEIGIKTDNPSEVEKIMTEVKKIVPENNFFIVSWKETNHTLLSAVKFEKFVLVAILSLLLLISSFAVSVILNMVVREKIKDIGILKSIGYSSKNIRKIFTIVGIIIGISGMILASIISPMILILLKKLFDVYMKGSYYYLDELPLYISKEELIIIYTFAILLVFISTIYPASKAAKLKPVEALKYE